MIEKAIEKLIDSVPLVVLMIGVLVFIIGASGGLPVGNPPLQVRDVAWRVGLGAMGLALVIVGLLFVAADSGFLSFTGSIKTIDENDLVPYMTRKIKKAKSSVCDITWAAPMQSTVTISDRLREEYYRAIEDVTRKSDKPVRYREIVIFYGLEKRISKAERLLSRAGRSYELAGYPDLPDGSPRRWQFIIVDEKEVVLKNLAVRHPKIVSYFVHCFNELWIEATPIRVSDYEPDLRLIEEAKRKLNEKNAVQQVTAMDRTIENDS